MALANHKLLLPLKCRLNTNLFLDCVKSIGYSASAVDIVPSNPYVILYQELRYLFLYYQYEQMSPYQLSAPKMIKFLLMLPSVKQYSPQGVKSYAVDGILVFI